MTVYSKLRLTNLIYLHVTGSSHSPATPSVVEPSDVGPKEFDPFGEQFSQVGQGDQK